MIVSLFLILHLPILIVALAIIAFFAKKNRYYGGKKYYKRRSYHPSPTFKPKRAQSRGIEGELEVSSTLGDSIPGRRYVFNDVLIKFGDQLSQIDHILVNRAGVFVIETKNYSGHIFGNLNSDNWTQISRKGRRYTFYNPIMQNESHVRIIRKIIGNDVPIFPLIVFVKSTPPTTYKSLVHISQLSSKLTEISSIINLSSEEIMKTAAVIKEHISHSSIDRAKHLEEAKNFKAKKAMRTMYNPKSSATSITSQNDCKSNDGLCPRCHKELVLRKLPYCDYWECSGAPNCSYTRKIDKT